MNPLDFSGNTFLVTGASSGIGREACLYLARLGARVGLIARDKRRLDETLAGMEGDGHLTYSMDLAMVGDIPERIRKIAADLGPISGLVHCAALNDAQPLRSWKPELHEKLMQINVTAALALAKGFRHSKVRAPNASIVLMSSVSGIIGTPSIVDYSASKGAIIGITRTLAVELARDDIRVNAIAAGLVNSGMGTRMSHFTKEQLAEIEKAYPLGIGEGIDVANSIIFLLSPMSRWITGSVLMVDGGHSIC